MRRTAQHALGQNAFYRAWFHSDIKMVALATGQQSDYLKEFFRFLKIGVA